MARMTGGQAIVRSLKRHDVDTIFGLPGVQLDALFNALYEERNEIRVVHTRHEQGAAYMAFGYARASGKPGVFAVVPGPGVLNAGAALSTAYACSTPVLCVTGQIPSKWIGKGAGQLHELPDQLAILRGLGKWAERIEHPSLAPGLVAEAFRQLASGRPRPVALEMAMDLMHRQAEVALAEPAPAAAPTVDPEQVAKAAKLLGEAEAPMIFAGSGALDAADEVLALAEMLQAPVSMARNSLGLVDMRNPLGHNLLTSYKLWQSADVILGVGTRLTPVVPDWGMDGKTIVRIDVDPVEMPRNWTPAAGILANAKSGLAALLEEVPKHNRKRASRADELGKLKAAMLKELEDNIAPQMGYLNAIRRVLPDDGIFLADVTLMGVTSRSGFMTHGPRRYIDSGYQATLGFGLPTALGAKVAEPETPVVAVVGDGGVMFTIQELATAVQHGIAAAIVVFNDNRYGNVNRMQRVDYGGTVIASDLTNPDFVKLAESFGAQGLRARGPAELEDRLKRAFDTQGPTLIEVPVEEDMPDPWSKGYIWPVPQPGQRR